MKSLKRVFALILLVALSVTSVFPIAFAAEAKQVLPIVDLRGFMSSQIYTDKNDPESTRLFPPETNAILTLASRLLPSVARLSVDKNWDAFGDQLIPALNDLFLPISADDQGNMKGNTGPLFTYPTKEEIEANPDVSFIFDWRDDPFVSAAQLNDFIDYLADDCGYGKVALECHSYAGVVTLTYLATYGVGKIESVCFNATAVYGAAFAGELMQGRVNLNADGLSAFLKGLIDQSEYERILRGLIALFDAFGGLDFLCGFVNDMFEHLSDRIWKESIVPVFGSWLSVWTMVPDGQLAAGNAFIASTGVTLSDAFRSRIAKYDDAIRSQREPLLQSLNDKRNLYVIARYGYAGVPLGDIWTENSDSVLTTQAESFGATCGRFDQTAVPPQNDLPMISPNGAIDAGTCLFPEQTWFIRNCSHMEKDPILREFTDKLLRAGTQQTVDSFAEYPRFLVLEKSNSRLSPDTGEARPTSKWEDFLRLVKEFLVRIRETMYRLFP